MLILFIASSLLYFSAIDALEFFRHTEADRTLIGWEMVRSGEYLVPHLLGSTILTKPPLFYWFVATSIQVFGSAAEWVARFPSAFLAILFNYTQYFFLKKIGFSAAQAFLGSLLIATGSQYFVLATSAEIDMSFGVFCGISLYLCFFATKDSSLKLTLLAYLFAAIAFLVKGPQIIIFFALGHTGYFLFAKYYLKQKNSSTLSQFLLWNILGVLLFVGVLLVWLIPLAERVTWAELGTQLQIEVLNRASAPSSRVRGPFFYLTKIPVGLLPWSLIPFTLFFLALKKTWRGSINGNSVPKDFLWFNLITLILGVLFLSTSSGKSSRYFFPLYTCAMNLCFLACLCLTNNLQRKIIPTCLTILFIAHVSYVLVYAPKRNQKYSVKPVAEEINQLMPKSIPLYTVELFERWLNYYLLLKHQRQSFRLTPDNIYKISGEVYLLLNKKEESWRLEQLGKENIEILKEFKLKSERVLLVKVTAKALAKLNPSARFPTGASPANIKT